jgi:hypothetical protein
VVVISNTALENGECYTLKLTYNSTSGIAKILIENKLDATSKHSLVHMQTLTPVYQLASTNSDIIFGAAAIAADGLPSAPWTGAMEEIYLKNVSTEFREVYIYTDNVRPSTAGGGTKVFVRCSALNSCCCLMI